MGNWSDALGEEKKKSYFKELIGFVENERAKGKIIYPPNKLVFNAFQSTNFDDISVVILGQDPYHGPNQAHGLCFSVPEGINPPPSLINIYKELNNDLNIQIPKSGCLERWTRQGVFLLNSVLTVEANKPASHAGKGWEQFTDTVIKVLNENKQDLVFMLWGAYAQRKGAVIDRTKHLVLEAPHPSPFSAHKGFLGCKHFSLANQWLKEKGKKAVEW